MTYFLTLAAILVWKRSYWPMIFKIFSKSSTFTLKILLISSQKKVFFVTSFIKFSLLAWTFSECYSVSYKIWLTCSDQIIFSDFKSKDRYKVSTTILKGTLWGFKKMLKNIGQWELFHTKMAAKIEKYRKKGTFLLWWTKIPWKIV